MSINSSIYWGCSNSSLIPWTVLSSPNGGLIHRFFDSSPFSPSNRFVALTHIMNKEGSEVNLNNIKSAEVILYDLHNNISKVIATTLAWDTQLGAHVQWGANDNQLFSNIMSNTTTPSLPLAVMYDISSNQSITLPSSVYHVHPKGTHIVTPDLTQIRFTQLGYGVYTTNNMPNRNASQYNGIYITEIATNTTRLLVSLYDLAVAASIDPYTIPCYGISLHIYYYTYTILFIYTP